MCSVLTDAKLYIIPTFHPQAAYCGHSNPKCLGKVSGAISYNEQRALEIFGHNPAKSYPAYWKEMGSHTVDLRQNEIVFFPCTKGATANEIRGPGVSLVDLLTGSHRAEADCSVLYRGHDESIHVETVSTFSSS